jgi:uncharacterized membrane protein YkoI
VLHAKAEIMFLLVRLLAVFLTAITLGATVAYAGGDGDRDDHDQALELYEHGEIRSLADILRFLGDRIHGDVVDVALDRQGDQWTYRLTVVTKDGQRTEVAVDASNMAIVQKAYP